MYYSETLQEQRNILYSW